jgi:ElaB/YqjD/DUF883 family membrane-anchored ribosome-binding protein
MKTDATTSKTTMNAAGLKSRPSAARKPNGGQSSLSHEFHNFLADIEDFINATTMLTGEDLAQATAKISERIATAKGSIENMGDAIAPQARKTVTGASDYVHTYPWKAIGASTAVAFLLGLLIARRP